MYDSKLVWMFSDAQNNSLKKATALKTALEIGIKTV